MYFAGPDAFESNDGSVNEYRETANRLLIANCPGEPDDADCTDRSLKPFGPVGSLGLIESLALIDPGGPVESDGLEDALCEFVLPHLIFNSELVDRLLVWSTCCSVESVSPQILTAIAALISEQYYCNEVCS